MNNPPKRRLYYFTPPEYALENIKNKQLKISRFSQCNDPYELLSFNLRNSELRRRHTVSLREIDKQNGMICFCRNWKNPVLWSYYAGHHKGLCLGFDVAPDNYVDVMYVTERLFPGITVGNFSRHVGEDQMTNLFATKFIHWAYEEEVRILIPFGRVVDIAELRFQPYADDLVLSQVMIGARSKINVEDVEDAVDTGKVNITQVRLAFNTFSVVVNEKKERWNRRD